jgi:uncharacterized FlaG/YvyC family protein
MDTLIASVGYVMKSDLAQKSKDARQSFDENAKRKNHNADERMKSLTHTPKAREPSHNHDTTDYTKLAHLLEQHLGLGSLGQHLLFAYDESTMTTQISIVDNKSNGVVKQLSLEYVLEISRAIIPVQRQGQITDARV